MPGSAKFLRYSGPSMSPLLTGLDIVEVLPYESRPVQVGDVVALRPANGQPHVIHRVVSEDRGRYWTRGDNNPRRDAIPVDGDGIEGRVVTAMRGSRSRTIRGGTGGRLVGTLSHAFNMLQRRTLPVLRTPYRSLAGSGLLRHWVPARYRPRLLLIPSRCGTDACLVLGSRVVGRFDRERCRWTIIPPYAVLIDEDRLPTGEQLDTLAS